MALLNTLGFNFAALLSGIALFSHSAFVAFFQPSPILIPLSVSFTTSRLSDSSPRAPVWTLLCFYAKHLLMIPSRHFLKCLLCFLQALCSKPLSTVTLCLPCWNPKHTPSWVFPIQAAKDMLKRHVIFELTRLCIGLTFFLNACLKILFCLVTWSFALLWLFLISFWLAAVKIQKWGFTDLWIDFYTCYRKHGRNYTGNWTLYGVINSNLEVY